MSSALTTSARALRASLRTRALLPAASARSFHTTLRRQEFFVDVNEETFQKAIQNKDKVVLVDFYADLQLVQPMQNALPILEKITTDPDAKSGSGRQLDLVTVDTDAEVDLAKQYDIRSLPTVLAFHDGKPLKQFVGALPEPQVRAFLQQV